MIDRTLALFGRAMSPFAGSYDPSHEITRGLRDPTLFHEVRSVKGGPGFTELVFTSEESWAERDLALLDAEGKAALDPTDLHGPVPVGVAGTPNLPADVAPPKAEGEAAAKTGGSSSTATPTSPTTSSSTPTATANLFVNTRQLADRRRRGDLDPAGAVARVALPAHRGAVPHDPIALALRAAGGDRGARRPHLVVAPAREAALVR